MGTHELDWLITLLSVHVVGLVGIIYIFRGAPCWIQKMSLIFLALAFVSFSTGYMGAILKVPNCWLLIAVGAVLEHFAVILYVFRLWWQTEEKKWKSSISSLS